MSETIQKCPYCNNNIKIDIVDFPVDNDYGGIIVKCVQCDQKSYTKIKNPVETFIRSGAKKIEYWDDDIIQDSEVLNRFHDIKALERGVLLTGDINQQQPTFNIETTSIHYCYQCGKSIEKLVYDILLQNESEIIGQYHTIMGAYHKGYTNGKYVIVELPITCTCGHKEKAFLYTSFDYGNFFTKKGIDELLLLGTKSTIKSVDLDRICSKSECISMLEKFIFRWNFLFPKILIATPFVGHQWMNEDQLLELWEWLLNTLDPQKTIFITRRATFNKYKKTFEKKNGITLAFLEDYDLDNKIISDFTSKQDFHAKIFAGISSEKTEVLAGSFNLLRGESFENLSYDTYNETIFRNNFISKLNIPIQIEPLEDVNCIFIYQDDNNHFCSKEIRKLEIDKQLLEI
jgi:hypothetical protein